MPSAELERSLKIKERLEASLTLKKLLLMLVLAGTSMVIADGVVTPAMSGALFCRSVLVILFPIDFGLLVIIETKKLRAICICLKCVYCWIDGDPHLCSCSYICCWWLKSWSFWVYPR